MKAVRLATVFTALTMVGPALWQVDSRAQPATCQSSSANGATMMDCSHLSLVLGAGQPEERFYRVFLPSNYFVQGNTKRYPVVYFFHGWSERYNQSSSEVGNYDTGDARYGADNLAHYVGTNKNVIIVKWDGFNPRFAGDNYVRPYNIGPVETHRQFPLYFPELVEHIDSSFRTIADREHRGVSGVSMGGFMALWVSGKYPHLVGSASSFMPSPEFFAGPQASQTEYLHTPMYRNYDGLHTRLITGSQDFIRWYHQRMGAVWNFSRGENHEVENFPSTHGTPGIAKTLDFHQKAFSNPVPKPEVWSHADIYPDFDVWGYSVTSNRQRPGFTLLENVSETGFRSSVREYMPDGKLLPSVSLTVTTDAIYKSGQTYEITDVNLDEGQVQNSQQVADSAGRLTFALNGNRHEVGIVHTASPNPIVTVADWTLVGSGLPTSDGATIGIKLKFTNKGNISVSGLTAQATSTHPQVSVVQRTLEVPMLGPGQTAESISELRFQARQGGSNAPRMEIAKLQIQIASTTIPLEIPLFPNVPAPANLVINDGGVVSMWEHATAKVRKSVGAGNGDGVANPGETIALLLPDGAAYRAGEMFTFDPCVDKRSGDCSGGQYLRWRLSDYWGGYDSVGASAKTSLPILISDSPPCPTCPPGHKIRFFVRYQLPNRPEHILREGIVDVTISGTDRTPPQPILTRKNGNVLQVDLREGSGVSSASAIFKKEPHTTVNVPLNDDGVNGDLAAGDMIFTGTIGTAPTGSYTLDISTEDALGNSEIFRMPGTYQLPRRAPKATGTR